MRTQTNNSDHHKIIGSIFIVFGAFCLIASLFAYNILEFIFSLNMTDETYHWGSDVITIDNPSRLFFIIPIITTVWACLQISAGLGVLKKQEWAEKLSMVLAIFMIFNMPLGTAFSIYIFYVFLHKDRHNSRSPHAPVA